MRRSILAGLLAWILFHAACAMPPDVERTWSALLERPGAAPALVEEPAAGLPPPEGLRADNGRFRSVRLEWEPLLAGDVGGYAVERSFLRDGPFERISAVRGRFSSVYVDRGESQGEAEDATALGDGTSLFYRVRAFAPSGHLAAAVSEVAVATTAPAPAAPVDLRAYNLQPRIVPLSWRAPEDRTVVGYVVERSPNSRGPFEPIARLEGRDETVWVDRGLGDLRVLHYRVAAFNAAGSVGQHTAAVRAVTKPEPLPPFQLRVVEQQLGSNHLEWDPNVEPDLAGYRLLRRRQGGDGPEVVAALPPDETRAVDSAVAADERVSYSILAVDRDSLESAGTAPLTLTSVGYALTARAGPSGVELRWNPRREEGWERARVLRARRLGARELAVVEGSEYVDGEIAPGGRYRYTVVLERGDATRAPASSPVEVTVPES